MNVHEIFLSLPYALFLVNAVSIFLCVHLEILTSALPSRRKTVHIYKESSGWAKL